MGTRYASRSMSSTVPVMGSVSTLRRLRGGGEPGRSLEVDGAHAFKGRQIVDRPSSDRTGTPKASWNTGAIFLSARR